MEYMTIKDIIELTSLTRQTILKAIKDLYPDKVKNGIRTVLDNKEAFEVIAKLKKTGYIIPDNISNEPVKNLQEPVKNLQVNKRQNIENNNNEILSEMLKVFKTFNEKIERLENKIDKLSQNQIENKDQKLLPSTQTEYEYLYHSTLAKKLECNNKWILDALYQLGYLKRNGWSGRYEIIEEFLDNKLLKYQNNSIMFHKSLMQDIARIINVWKSNQQKLF